MDRHECKKKMNKEREKLNDKVYELDREMFTSKDYYMHDNKDEQYKAVDNLITHLKTLKTTIQEVECNDEH